ncbi:sulfotransferase family protein [Promicromonospora kroppenstedtii]|uniref:sulfotransferase family protein n=1 Tax=Promicromonospora kroppenstedtii TaxID=440482 RepID=UPI0004BBD11E|nr:sulfotransferase [Promicromonospora kroppenstedtii]
MPQATPLLRLLNVLLAPGLRTRKDPDAVFERLLADAQSGRVALGDDELAALDGLRLLLADHAANPDLSGMGWSSTQSQIRTRLTNRAIVRDVQASRPEVRDEPVTAPVFVVGLPRTGTTLTYNLIARHPGNRGPKLWEMDNLGLPRPQAEREKLIAQARKRYATVARLSPVWGHLHPLVADGEEEDFMLRAHTEMYATWGPAPRYLDWVANADLTEDYRFLRNALQIMAAGEAPDRWVLKHPMDLWRMPEILAAFPGARFVWTHRAPAATVASGCSMAEATQVMYIKPGRIDLERIGQEWLGISARGVERAVALREQLPDDAVIDVVYDDLMKDPETVVHGLFENLGLEWGATDDANLAAALDRSGHRPHAYSLERYGLDEAQVAEAFSAYRIPASVLG